MKTETTIFYKIDEWLDRPTSRFDLMRACILVIVIILAVTHG